MNIIKSVLFNAVIVSVLAVGVVSCGGKTMQGSGGADKEGPGTGPIPCYEFDTKEYMTGFGEYRGSSHQFGENVIHATNRAKDNARQKMGGAFKGVATSYRASHGNNQGNDVINKMEQGYEEVISKYLNDMHATCAKQGPIGDDGHQSVFVSFRISRADFSNHVTQAVTDKLTEDEKLSIDFKESQFKDRFKHAFEEFKGNN
ncbi:MAG: hypothetical protein LBI42_03530 [Chitinispirillales bacterium]|jgi:hypothetical protein|nr:hypothetical protein [Chitinispirillales bacterium]